MHFKNKVRAPGPIARTDFYKGVVRRDDPALIKGSFLLQDLDKWFSQHIQI